MYDFDDYCVYNTWTATRQLIGRAYLKVKIFSKRNKNNKLVPDRYFAQVVFWNYAFGNSKQGKCNSLQSAMRKVDHWDGLRASLHDALSLSYRRYHCVYQLVNGKLEPFLTVFVGMGDRTLFYPMGQFIEIPPHNPNFADRNYLINLTGSGYGAQPTDIQLEYWK